MLALVGRDGQRQRHQAPCRPLPYDGGVRRARVRPKVVLKFGRDPRPNPNFLRQRAFRSITRSVLFLRKSRRKWAVGRRHHAVVSLAAPAVESEGLPSRTTLLAAPVPGEA